MPQDTGIGEERLVSMVGMVVSAANTHLLDANDRLSWTRRRRIGHRGQMEIAWIIEDNSAHLEIPLGVRSTERDTVTCSMETHLSWAEEANTPSSP
jgi:hypothetical protein